MSSILVLITGALFAGSHLAMSSAHLRPQLQARFGARGFLGVYSLVAAGTLAAHIAAYTAAPHVPLQFTTPAWIPRTLMAAALFFIIGGFTVPNPTAVMQDGQLAKAPRGVLRITRHPVMWGFLIWAVAHMAANGDVSSLLFFGTFALLAALGMQAMDRRKSQAADWAGFAAVTSTLPFAAIAGGRNTLPPNEIVVPVVLAALLYVVMLWAHPYVSGGMAIA